MLAPKKSHLLILLVLMANFAVQVMAEDIEPVHFAYANYLGSGIYKTTEQNASLISMPFAYEFGQKEKTSFSLRLPISVGFFDFELTDIPSLELPNEVGTVTFTPGVAFKYQYNSAWVIESYADLGYGRNLTTKKGVTISSAGISALYHFNLNEIDSIWASRVYYANYEGNGYDAVDSFAAMQTGIDSGLPLQYQILGYRFQPRMFATVFWYFNEVDFLMPRTRAFDTGKNVTLTNSIELGVTLKFEKTIGYDWAGIERLGLSYRYSKGFNAFRLLFTFPI